MLNGELADYDASPLEAAHKMAKLKDHCIVYWKYVDDKAWLKKNEIGRYLLENAGEFFEALGLWGRINKYGNPWGTWADAPAHIWDVIEAIDRVSAGIQAEKMQRKGKP